MGAFTEDSPEGVYGHYNAALTAYGWSLDSTGKVIDNYLAKMVHALTFNAPPMGWVFQKPALQETDPGNGVYNYRFVYLEEKGVAHGLKNLRNFNIYELKALLQHPCAFLRAFDVGGL